MQPIGELYDAVAGATLAPMTPVRVPLAGGLSMHGYLTLPPGRAGRNLPAVMLPHGGPYSRDGWGYDPLVQLLASRGYAVLQVNYRGSTGYGTDWLAAGFQGWGTVMHDDITTAARWLAAEGIADPRRMCIVGWSYGGYAALIGAVKEPDLYRCAVSIAGVSDLAAIANEDSRFYGGRAATVNSTGAQDLEALSPRRHVARIKAPILLVHGHADIQVVADHSKKMADALQRAGKPHDLLLIQNGDHSLRTPAMRLVLYEKLAAFLSMHLDAP
jgi:dipeptidyl aminopeptidase/acylaminoacyl peptidase